LSKKEEIIFEIHHTVPFTGPDSLRICDGSRYGIVFSLRHKKRKQTSFTEKAKILVEELTT
jgi:hypothetical protein